MRPALAEQAADKRGAAAFAATCPVPVPVPVPVREVALGLLAAADRTARPTVGADHGYDTRDFVDDSRPAPPERSGMGTGKGTGTGTG